MGPGALMKSLGQFGAEGDIDNTLTGSRCAADLEWRCDRYGGNLSWSNVDPPVPATRCTSSTVPTDVSTSMGPPREGRTLPPGDETGWIRMGITQDEQPKGTTSKVPVPIARHEPECPVYGRHVRVAGSNRREASLGDEEGRICPMA